MLQPAMPPPTMTTRARSLRSRSARGEAAVHDQLGAGHERGLVAREEERDVGDLARPRDAPERDARLELLADLGRQVRRLERRVHDPGMDHVAADLVARELDRERLTERDE